MRILVFGDSIAEGFWDYEKGGWVDRLKADFWKKYEYDNCVKNYGIAAHTTSHLIQYFSSFFEAVSKREAGKFKDTLIIFAIGINDSARNIVTNEHQVLPEIFQKNIAYLSELCKSEKLITEVIWISAINVDEELINATPEEYRFYNTDIRDYNSMIEKNAFDSGNRFLDVYGAMSQEDLEIDGLHPNAAGHEKLFEQIKDYLETKVL